MIAKRLFIVAFLAMLLVPQFAFAIESYTSKAIVTSGIDVDDTEACKEIAEKLKDNAQTKEEAEKEMESWESKTPKTDEDGNKLTDLIVKQIIRSVKAVFSGDSEDPMMAVDSAACDNEFSFMRHILKITAPVKVTDIGPVMTFTKYIEMLASCLIIIYIVVYGFQYTVGKHEQEEPGAFVIKMFFVLLAIQFAPYIIQEFLNINNLIVYYISNIPLPISGWGVAAGGSAVLGVALMGALAQLLAATVAIMAVPGAGLVIVAFILILIVMLLVPLVKLMVWWYARFFTLILYTALSPLFFLMYANKGTKAIGKKFFKELIGEIFSQVIVVIGFYFIVVLLANFDALWTTHGIGAIGMMLLAYTSFTVVAELPHIASKFVGGDSLGYRQMAGALSTGVGQAVANGVDRGQRKFQERKEAKAQNKKKEEQATNFKQGSATNFGSLKDEFVGSGEDAEALKAQMRPVINAKRGENISELSSFSKRAQNQAVAGIQKGQSRDEIKEGLKNDYMNRKGGTEAEANFVANKSLQELEANNNIDYGKNYESGQRMFTDDAKPEAIQEFDNATIEKLQDGLENNMSRSEAIDMMSQNLQSRKGLSKEEANTRAEKSMKKIEASSRGGLSWEGQRLALNEIKTGNATENSFKRIAKKDAMEHHGMTDKKEINDFANKAAETMKMDNIGNKKLRDTVNVKNTQRINAGNGVRMGGTKNDLADRNVTSDVYGNDRFGFRALDYDTGGRESAGPIPSESHMDYEFGGKEESKEKTPPKKNKQTTPTSGPKGPQLNTHQTSPNSAPQGPRVKTNPEKPYEKPMGPQMKSSGPQVKTNPEKSHEGPMGPHPKMSKEDFTRMAKNHKEKREQIYKDSPGGSANFEKRYARSEQTDNKRHDGSGNYRGKETLSYDEKNDKFDFGLKQEKQTKPKGDKKPPKKEVIDLDYDSKTKTWESKNNNKNNNKK